MPPKIKMDIEKMIYEYENGYTLQDLESKYRISVCAIRNAMTNKGVKFRRSKLTLGEQEELRMKRERLESLNV